jgi:transposase
MSAKRYELNQVQWERITTLLPGKPGDPGRTASDNRLSVNGVMGVLRLSAHWCDLPVEDGAQTAQPLVEGGGWDRVLADLIKDRDHQYLMIDGTLVRAHQQAATGNGLAIRLWGAFPKRTGHQDPYGSRHLWKAEPLHPDCRSERRCNPPRRPCWRPSGQGRPRRQSLRFQRPCARSSLTSAQKLSSYPAGRASSSSPTTSPLIVPETASSAASASSSMSAASPLATTEGPSTSWASSPSQSSSFGYGKCTQPRPRWHFPARRSDGP